MEGLALGELGVEFSKQKFFLSWNELIFCGEVIEKIQEMFCKIKQCLLLYADIKDESRVSNVTFVNKLFHSDNSEKVRD